MQIRNFGRKHELLLNSTNGITKFLLLVWLGSREGVGEVVRCAILVPVHCHGPVPLVVPAKYANEK